MKVARPNLETVLVAAIVLFIILLSGSTLILPASSLTRDEAVEVSRNSPLIRDWLARADVYTVEAFHMNSSEADRARQEFPALGEEYPENRSIWVVVWNFHPVGAVSGFLLCANHVIDDETGRIVFESTMSLR